MSKELTWSELVHDDASFMALLQIGQTLVITHEGRPIGRLVPSDRQRRPWIVGVCGASGVGYAAALIRGLIDVGEPVDLIVSRAAKLTIMDETGVPFREADWAAGLQAWTTLCGFKVEAAEGDIRCWPPADFTAGPASGSYLAKGMVVVPATTAAVGGIANGLSKDLVQRAAEVTLKERRPLVVVPRETPFTRVTLQNLLALDEMGAVVLPASPGFYAGTTDVSNLYGFIAGKILDLLGVNNTLLRRWNGVLGAVRESDGAHSASSDAQGWQGSSHPGQSGSQRPVSGGRTAGSATRFPPLPRLRCPGPRLPGPRLARCRAPRRAPGHPPAAGP